MASKIIDVKREDVLERGLTVHKPKIISKKKDTFGEMAIKFAIKANLFRSKNGIT